MTATPDPTPTDSAPAVETSPASPPEKPRRVGQPRPTASAVVAAISRLPRGRMAPKDGVPDGPSEAELARVAERARRKQETIQIALLGAAVIDTDPKAVAERMGWTVAGLEAYLAEHRAFANKFEDLCRKVTGIAPEPVALAVTDVWTDEKRARLIEKYVDRGDLLEAQEFVGATPSQFNRHVRENAAFARDIEAARKEAATTLEMRAKSEALGGNDRLLGVFLKANDGDKATALQDLSDAQLAQRLAGLLARIRERMNPPTEAPTPPAVVSVPEISV